MFLTGFISLSILLFYLCQSTSSSLSTILDAISSNIDEFLLINPSANVHHKDWPTFSGGIDRPRELGYNFSVSKDLTHMVNCTNRIPDRESQSCCFGFIYSDTSICSPVTFPSVGNSYYVVVSVSIDLPSNSK